MARQGGLEPPTAGLEIRCSIHLSYWRAHSIVFDRLHVSGALSEKIAGTFRARKFTRSGETDPVEETSVRRPVLHAAKPLWRAAGRDRAPALPR